MITQEIYNAKYLPTETTLEKALFEAIKAAAAEVKLFGENSIERPDDEDVTEAAEALESFLVHTLDMKEDEANEKVGNLIETLYHVFGVTCYFGHLY